MKENGMAGHDFASSLMLSKRGGEEVTKLGSVLGDKKFGEAGDTEGELGELGERERDKSVCKIRGESWAIVRSISSNFARISSWLLRLSFGSFSSNYKEVGERKEREKGRLTSRSKCRSSTLKTANSRLESL